VSLCLFTGASGSQLVHALEQRWLQLASQLVHVEDIAVIGIDLTRRSG
jgi:hypothetical protein